MPDEIQKSVNPMTAAAGGLTLGGGVVAAVMFFRDHLLTFVLILAAILVPLLGGYLFIVHRRKKKRQQMFKAGMDSGNAASPRGISDPNKRAKLDELRRKFMEGVNAYKARGKDLASLPWYVIVGEPGGGKSEAIRHSNIGFPPGLQDELQGVGGTINMHWWFSDRAVLLDTAGRLIFEEVPAGESSEWKEFLTLLKTTRPNCPVNGMILVIPCDSLIKDTEAEIDKKARKLAQQLDLIQRTLDVRFPVSVLITKADLLVGFREFFDDVRDPRLQHQMFGWSNPEKLDSPFRPGEVDRFLEEVAGRLSKRRLALLRDPAPDQKDGRRADEVDTLFALPHSLANLAPRLRRYLETIFAQGSWSLPPLFLRGIYFSSALREGAALDADLAQALGVPVDSFSDFKVWERERSFFLRDLFVDKMFREFGLVTRATNTGEMLRKRKQLLFGGGTIALLVFVLCAWLGMRSFRNSVEAQQLAWSKVASTNWQSELGLLQREGSLYQPVSDSQAFNERQERIALDHLAIREQATNQLRLDFIGRIFFGGLADDYRKKSANAQRFVFEKTVVEPLVEATRQKLGSDTASSPEMLARQIDAYATLLNLEAGIQNRWGGTNLGKPEVPMVASFANPLTRYVAGTELNSGLAETWSWVYSKNPTMIVAGDRGKWPPDALTDNIDPSIQKLSGYPDLQAGLQGIFRGVTNTLGNQLTRWRVVTNLHSQLVTISDLERRMMAAAAANNAQQAVALRQEFLSRSSELGDWLRINSTELGEGGLAAQQERVRALLMGGGGGGLDRIRDACTGALARTEHPLFGDVLVQLDAFKRSLSKTADQLLSDIPADEMKLFDENYLDTASSEGRRSLLVRAEAYAEVVKFAGNEAYHPPGKISRAFGYIKEMDDQVEALRKRGQNYQAGMGDGFRKTYDWFVTHARGELVSIGLTEYLDEARLIGAGLPFPLGTNRNAAPLNAGAVINLRQVVSDVRKDINSDGFRKTGAVDRPAWIAFMNNVDLADGLTSALMTGNTLSQVSVVVEDNKAGPDEQWRTTYEFASTFPGQSRRSWDINRPQGEPLILGSIRVDEPIKITVYDRERSLNPAGGLSLDLTTGPWGALELLHLEGATPDVTRPGVWSVAWPVKQGSRDVLRLRLEFLGGRAPTPKQLGH
ncbi:MAG TPA: hypothetical protein DCY13_19535 [Verrucomicrobiales bacterium]|nr:hypothetical protein [Verrucomicrobiales bacterium]